MATAIRKVKSEDELLTVSAELHPETYKRLQRASEIQQHEDGQLERILIEWALPFYEQARSVEILYALDVRPGRKATKR
jgi:hypothetical protein